ncbi:DUF6011 domain-containing protein [Nocardioides sp.]|uniref:DUF6011 domain-containing protein n=1 Tax=Nocardioides sp. TaxID=35761 RepID=UPI0039C8E8C0
MGLRRIPQRYGASRASSATPDMTSRASRTSYLLTPTRPGSPHGVLPTETRDSGSACDESKPHEPAVSMPDEMRTAPGGESGGPVVRVAADTHHSSACTRCERCNAALTAARSIERGLGPVCCKAVA